MVNSTINLEHLDSELLEAINGRHRNFPSWMQADISEVFLQAAPDLLPDELNPPHVVLNNLSNMMKDINLPTIRTICLEFARTEFTHSFDELFQPLPFKVFCMSE